MSDVITISLNELRALLRKAFEGVFGHSRDWNAMTDNVIWLECHGYDGVDKFFKCYPDMHRGRKASLSFSSDGEILIDPNGTSMLEYVHLLCDIILASARKNGTAKARISSAKNPDVTQAAMHRFAKAGFGSNLTVTENEILIELNSTSPQYNHSEDHYLHILDNGFPMKKADYIKLCEYADKVLVPATEQSRRGAGE